MRPASADLPRLLVLASTYPRWAGDPEPAFVHQLCVQLRDRFAITVLAPHAPGAATREVLDGIDVVRYRYAPARWETLVHDGGIAGNLRRHRAKALLLPGFVLGQAWAAWRLVRRSRPAVVHAHWLVPQGLVLRLLAWLSPEFPPWVVTSHGADLHSLRSAPFVALKRWVARGATRLTVVSRAMVEEIRALGVDGDRVAVEPMGTDLRHRFTVDPSVTREREQLLFVGRLVPKKGVEHLLRAMPAIVARRPDARLAIVGFGPEREALQQLASDLGIASRVSFEGAVANDSLPDRYRRASVFVAPFVRAPGGDQEGLGLVMVEAAGCGCRIVAGDVPAVHDVLVDPRIGVAVPAADTDALAGAVVAALAADDAPADVAARSAAVARFDWVHRGEAYAALLAEAAATGLARRRPVR